MRNERQTRISRLLYRMYLNFHFPFRSSKEFVRLRGKRRGMSELKQSEEHSDHTLIETDPKCGKKISIWQDIHMQQEMVHRLAKDLQIKEMEDWYHVKSSQIREKGGTRLLKQYARSPMKMIMSIFPEHDWIPWKFDEKLKKGSWDDLHFQREFVEYVAKEYKLEDMEDWYNITQSRLHDKGGGHLLKMYNSSPMKILTTLFPDHKWELSKFSGRKGMWNDIALEREFIMNLASKLKINSMEEWYNVGLKQIRAVKGEKLSRTYNYSVMRMMTSVFPEHNWDKMRFAKRRGLWTEQESQKDFLTKLAKELKITEMKQWYHVSVLQMRKKGASGLLSKYNGSPKTMIMSLFPEHKWNPSRFNRNNKENKTVKK